MSDEETYTLKGSTGILGQLYPVLKDKYGNVIDGFHRLGEDPLWHDQVVSDIDTPFKLALARLAANTSRRAVSDTEKTDRLREIYEEYRKEHGDFPEHEDIAKWLGRSQRWIYQYLPKSLKGEQGPKPNNQKIAETANSEVKLPGEGSETAPKEFVFSPRASEFAVKADTPAEQVLCAELSRRGLPYKSNEPLVISETERYIPDITLPKLIVECEGDGSKSRDNGEREKKIREKGYLIYHFSNREILGNVRRVGDMIEQRLRLGESNGVTFTQPCICPKCNSNLLLFVTSQNGQKLPQPTSFELQEAY